MVHLDGTEDHQNEGCRPGISEANADNIPQTCRLIVHSRESFDDFKALHEPGRAGRVGRSPR